MVGSNSQISNLLDFKQWQQLGAEKYPIYEADDGDLTYLSQPSYEQINKTSALSMYGCLVGDLCGGAFGGPATKRPPPQEKRNEKNSSHHRNRVFTYSVRFALALWCLLVPVGW
jgi:hypothetical protein